MVVGYHQNPRPRKWSWYYLDVILDFPSFYVVGRTVTLPESAALAEVLIRQTCAEQGIGRAPHRPSTPTASSLSLPAAAFLLADPARHQPPRARNASDDNPFSEAQFKTLKYWPDFPMVQLNRGWLRHCQTFFGWVTQ